MTPRAHTSLILAAILALCAVASPLRAQEDEGYAMRPGDKVTVSLYTAAGEQVGVVSGERILDRDGDLYLPYVGTIHAAGQDQTSLREVLVERFGAFYSQPVVNVKVELRVNVTGSVVRPGQYYLDPSFLGAVVHDGQRPMRITSVMIWMARPTMPLQNTT